MDGRPKTFEECEVWQLSRDLTEEIFELMSSGRFGTDYRLKDQINGSTGSIMDNIAEGFERDGNKELIAFLSYAKGSAGEARSQLYRSLDRKYITQHEFDILVEKVKKISRSLSGFMTYLNNKTEYRGRKFKDR
jgi:four helix bundle protein